MLSTLSQDSEFKSKLIRLCELRSILYDDIDAKRFILRDNNNTWVIHWSGNNNCRYIKVYRRLIFFLPIKRCILHFTYTFYSAPRSYTIEKVCQMSLNIHTATITIDAICTAFHVQISNAHIEEEHILEAIHQPQNIDTEELQSESEDVSRLGHIELIPK